MKKMCKCVISASGQEYKKKLPHIVQGKRLVEKKLRTNKDKVCDYGFII